VANHYCEFSAVLPNLQEAEEAWLQEQLTKICVFGEREYPEDGMPDDLCHDEADWYGPRFLRDQGDESVDPLGFSYDFRDDDPQPNGNGWGRHLWFYAEEQGYPEHVALLVQEFLARFRPNDSWEFSCAYYCSKPVVGQFGGESYFVTAGGIQRASDLLERFKQQFPTRQHPEKRRQTATLTVDVDYDPAITDPESLASAMDVLMRTALSTPGILEEYGDPVVGQFLAPRDYVAYVITDGGNREPSIDVFHSDTPIALKRVVAYYESAKGFTWDREGITMVGPSPNPPTDLDAWEADNDGEDDEDE